MKKTYALLGATKTGYGCHRRFNDLHSALTIKVKDDDYNDCYDIAILTENSDQKFSWNDVFEDDLYNIYRHNGTPVYNKDLDLVFIDTTTKVTSELLKYLDAEESTILFKHLVQRREKEEKEKKEEKENEAKVKEYNEYKRIKELFEKYEK